MSTPQTGPRLTGVGKAFIVIFILGCAGLAYWLMNRGHAAAPQESNTTTTAGAVAADTQKNALDPGDLLAPTLAQPNALPPPLAYVPKDPTTIDIELSEYAGYSGLIVANGGLIGTTDSPLFKKSGIKLNIKISEEESWAALNTGKMAASATTADVLAVYGRQFSVVVPAQIGYSRGADGVVVRSDIKRINDLKGKIVAASEFTESDFFLRFLAQEANVPVKMLADLNAPVDPDAINVVFAKDGFAAGDLFAKSLDSATPLAGCVTWAPKTTEIPEQSGGKARLLVSNKNLLIVADILIFNRGYADKNPDKVAAIVDGLLMGNRMVRENPAAYKDIIAKAFNWDKKDRPQTLDELQKVHLSNLPENLAFFSGGIMQGGSFQSIYQSAVLAYGNDIIPQAADSDRFMAPAALKAAEASGDYKNQVAAIVPLAAATGGRTEVDPVLSKDIRFLFKPNSSDLDMTDDGNLKNLASIKRILDVAPGSHIILVGHVDDSNIPALRASGGEALVQKIGMEAMDLSKRRAMEVRNQLQSQEKVDVTRLETVGKGWTQPASKTNPDANRRVEVQWFTME